MKPATLQWSRPRLHRSELADYRTWDEAGGQWRIGESVSRYGLPTLYRVLQWVPSAGGWRIVETFAVRRTAAADGTRTETRAGRLAAHRKALAAVRRLTTTEEKPCDESRKRTRGRLRRSA